MSFLGPKLFTEREMREITRKNYKKLPEVQQKLRNNREHVLRKADKFIVNTFTKVSLSKFLFVLQIIIINQFLENPKKYPEREKYVSN